MIFPADQVWFTVGERKPYGSSPGIGRALCDQCGTPLTIESRKHTPATTEFHISTFDEPKRFVLNLHWYHSRRLSWFDVADDLLRYDGLDADGAQPISHGSKTNGH